MILEQIRKNIIDSQDSGFLASEFYKFGDKILVDQALAKLADEDFLEEIGSDIYAKKKDSKYFKEKIYADGFQKIINQVLFKLGIIVYENEAVIAYNSGKSTQVPTGRAFYVNKIPPPIMMTFGGKKDKIYFFIKEV